MTPARIRRLRKRLGLTQQAFADCIGTDQSTVSRWENKGVPPSGPALRLLQQIEASPITASARPGPSSAEAA